MSNVITKLAKRFSLFLLVTAMLSSCGTEGFAMDGKPEFSQPSYQRTPPAVQMPVFAAEAAEVREDGERKGMIDLSNTGNGYVGVNVTAPVRGKFRVARGTEGAADYSVYDYDLETTGVNEFFPLAMGDGAYSFTIFLNIEGGKYEYFLTAEAQVQLSSEFAPFLVPNKIVNYTPDSDVVKFSYTLAEHASTDLEVVQQVYYWVQKNITYDTAKPAELASSGGMYVPNPDEILRTKTGICYDYAALTAAMLRANGIPCKLVMGNVPAGESGLVYHAWNLIWLEDKGWVAVKIPTTPAEWQRIDLTFAASGDANITEFIGDGSNYFDMSEH